LETQNQTTQMIHRLIFLLSILFTGQALFARQVPIEEAKHAALQFYSERVKLNGSTDRNSLFHITGTFITEKDNLPVYYIFNINDKGFVIVSADDAVTPVFAYSFEGTFSRQNPAPQFTEWMGQYTRQICYARKMNTVPLSSADSAWSHLLNPGSSLDLPQKTIQDVEPLISSNWDQPFPYNGMCPADPAGSNGHAIAGCVPVAMGQIMYYYRWPDHGIGSYTYFDSTYGNQHVSFDSTWYRWNNMKDRISTSDTGIAQLLYHLGVSVDLKYGPSSSGMYNHKAAYALRTYFKYSPETSYIYRDSTNMDWDSLIIAHLNRKMPLYYAGWSVPNVEGHAFVCDGYQGNYFHFNFGWSGTDNGYYYPDSITPGGDNFDLAQELIINIYPDTINYSYPPYCSGTTTLTYDQGSLTDGSGPVRDYRTGTDCSWLITPQTAIDSISKITLTFDGLATNPGDSVTVYDGPDMTAPVLASYSGITTPLPISSTGNKMFIKFRAQGNVPDSGWSANYSTTLPVFCSGQKTITADTADITDGSLRFNYNNNSLCRWLIMPASGKKPLTIYFRSFDTEPLKDVLKILDPVSHDTLAIISGHYTPSALPDSVTSPSGQMFIIFSTNSSVTAEGFELYYPKSTLGIIEKSLMTDLKVFPNPAYDRINVSFQCNHPTHLEMTLSSIQGQPLVVKNTICTEGINLLNIPVDVPSGLYLLRLQNENTCETYKIVITKQ
jgi:hypothetical protein